jgi:hypothetical protein
MFLSGFRVLLHLQMYLEANKLLVSVVLFSVQVLGRAVCRNPVARRANGSDVRFREERREE